MYTLDMEYIQGDRIPRTTGGIVTSNPIYEYIIKIEDPTDIIRFRSEGTVRLVVLEDMKITVVELNDQKKAIFLDTYLMIDEFIEKGKTEPTPTEFNNVHDLMLRFNRKYSKVNPIVNMVSKYASASIITENDLRYETFYLFEALINTGRDHLLCDNNMYIASNLEKPPDDKIELQEQVLTAIELIFDRIKKE